jgi:hypothetical protein
MLITVNSAGGINTVFTETGENGSIQHQLITPPTPAVLEHRERWN